jgi:hypothetical protein
MNGNSVQTPRDLAGVVFGKISSAEDVPPLEVLSEVFQTLFLVSLETEEGTSIEVSICYINPRKPDPRPPPFIRSDRWRFTAFGHHLPFTIDSLSKIALAIDHEVASIAIFVKRNKPYLVGVVDQQHKANAHRRYEAQGTYQSPGVFQVQVVGLGHLMVLQGDAVIAELKGGTLIRDAVDVFSNGPIAAKLRPPAAQMARGLRGAVLEAGYRWDREDTDGVYEAWTQTLCRILNRAKSFGHGGTLLISPEAPGPNLGVNYLFPYTKLSEALFAEVLSATIQYYAGEFLDADEDEELALEAYPEMLFHGSMHEDARTALEGAIGLISSLTRVDGAVLMTPNLQVVGFGCEITVPRSASRVYLARAASGSGRKKIELETFGTRHRSVVRYCNAVPGSVGFVVSQDGHVRGITKVGNDVLLWDNVALSQHLVSKEGNSFAWVRR